MAGRKLVPSPTKVGTVINATHWSLPLLTAEARRLSTHPEVWDGVKEQAVKLQKSTMNEPDGVPTTADPVNTWTTSRRPRRTPKGTPREG